MRFLTLIAVVISIPLIAPAQPRPQRGPLPAASAGKVLRDITYATNGGVALKLDVYLPKGKTNQALPTAVYIHGGGWRSGSKTIGSWFASVTAELNARGYVVAAVEYRLSPNVKWPAYINDVKCAIRFLRKNATEYHIDPEHIGTWGTSAGGHLVALLGTADADAKLEGDHYLDQSSRVQAVVDLFGPSDINLLAQEAQHRERGRVVFGDTPEILTQASPITYVSHDDPPFLIIQGEDDKLVAPVQAKVLYEKLNAAGVPAKLVMVKNGTHGLSGPNLIPSRAELLKMIADFFDQHLKTKEKN